MKLDKYFVYMLILIVILCMFPALSAHARGGGRHNGNRAFSSMQKRWDERRDRWRNNWNNMQERWQDGWNNMRERQQDRREQMRDNSNNMWDNDRPWGGRNR